MTSSTPPTASTSSTGFVQGHLGLGLRGKVAFLGKLGAYSHQACLTFAPHLTPHPARDVDQALRDVQSGEAEMAMLPVENALGGRVAEVHRSMQETHLSIIGEGFLPVHHALMGIPSSDLTRIKVVWSHPQALAQCRGSLAALGVEAREHHDTASAAQMVQERGDVSHGALASTTAAALYGLRVLREGMEDDHRNVTRFLGFAREPAVLASPPSGRMITALMFALKSTPAALYKCLGVFATERIDLLRIESYIALLAPDQASFFVEAATDANAPQMLRALEELRYYTVSVKLLGCYAANRPTRC